MHTLAAATIRESGDYIFRSARPEVRYAATIRERRLIENGVRSNEYGTLTVTHLQKNNMLTLSDVIAVEYLLAIIYSHQSLNASLRELALL